jgi:hypothetical protein
MKFQNVGVYENLISGSRFFDGYKLKGRSTLLGVFLGCESSRDELILRNPYKYSSTILYFLHVSDHWFYLTFLIIFYKIFPSFAAPVIFALIFENNFDSAKLFFFLIKTGVLPRGFTNINTNQHLFISILFPLLSLAFSVPPLVNVIG